MPTLMFGKEYAFGKLEQFNVVIDHNHDLTGSMVVLAKNARLLVVGFDHKTCAEVRIVTDFHTSREAKHVLIFQKGKRKWSEPITWGNLFRQRAHATVERQIPDS